mgnify:CR=1|tara:strand:+ start:1118 stop:1696 length:579 start_codon:yes stop_codon:yes gene_type:complete
MSNIVLKGSTSGDVTITVPAEAGTNTLTLPAGTGNIITSTTAGTIIQVVNVQTGALVTGTTVMPMDDTIPQNGEGVQVMTLAITPTHASNKLLITVNSFLAHSFNGEIAMTAALFQDSTAGALAATSTTGAVNQAMNISLTHFMAAGTTNATTFKVRAGDSHSGTLSFNGQSGARRHGGVGASSITITEIAV